ncbi:hypothetical protein [Microvirga arsenatis]|uniref:Uncharacterized protein n=1 Tax=Microvirga arsenatis TaxID=2692265 RepID=A0ABW9Z3X5_9HYPH|nr:hypothetical protein [Microvirga arsenatis]NBJ13695.1 hypothetical protein [Microvirga arsenatis]NBJ27155.1 hypothetical protein [Microvirga arsenatis]
MTMSVNICPAQRDDFLPIDVAADYLVGPIMEILKQYHQSDYLEPVRAHFRTLLKWMARDLENFVQPMVSVAAQERAKEMGLPDLRQFRWKDQPKKMKDPGRAIFHWEHYTPVANIVRDLLEINTPSRETVTDVLKTARIAWILKEENACLNHRSRPDSDNDYRAVGIRLLPAAQPHSL